jgi:hypothetical protein
MNAIKEIRRAGILMSKRFSLFKYNIKLRMQRGEGYDIKSDVEMM